MNTTSKSSRKLWIIVLILSLIFLIVLCAPPLELYFGANVPFITIDHTHFNIFGMDFVGYQKQSGIMLMCGVLMMLPGRLIPLAIAKLMN